MHPTKKLFRNPNDAIISGVCSGLAEYFEVDSVFVRLLAAGITVFTGIVPGVVVYILAIMIVPVKPGSVPPVEVQTPQAAPPSETPPQSNDA